MAAYKSEFLAQHYKGRLHPLHHYIFGFADKLARWGSLAPALTNAILTGPLTSPLIKRIAGVAQQRQLPQTRRQKFRVRARFQFQNTSRREAQLAPPQVVLWPDTWNNYYHPQTLAAAETVLSQAGFEVVTPQRPHLLRPPALRLRPSRRRARLSRQRSRSAWRHRSNAGLPFIFLEPSCASVFKDELPELFPTDPRAQRMREQVWLLADWLAEKAPGFATGRLDGAHILIHGHCHHKAVFGGPRKEIALLRQAGATVELIEAGCCGMAGPFRI